ncbi:MAG: hypothetical protein LBQ54_08895 [Planctomycetaceae bacterium]|nr:hypothetical protein [Planctomycetaceae bacterium]
MKYYSGNFAVSAHCEDFLTGGEPPTWHVAPQSRAATGQHAVASQPPPSCAVGFHWIIFPNYFPFVPPVDTSEQRERVIEAEGNCDGTARSRCYSS